MPEQPLVSIIIATYKKFDYIEKVLQSVFIQDYPRLEIVLADDGSENFPKTEIEKYIQKNAGSNIVQVQVYANETNVGTVRNLNEAHRRSTGTIAVELAGDDEFFDAQVISRIVERMQETGSGVLATSRYVVDENGEGCYFLPHRAQRKHVMKCSREKQYRMFVSGQFYAMFSGSALAIRADVFNQTNGYDEKYRLWEDGPFVEKVLRTTRIEPAFDIVQINYHLGGISTGEVHPMLQKEMEIYNQTDRISHIDEIGTFGKALTLYNISGRVGLKQNGFGLYLPTVLLYKLIYRIRFVLTEKMDQAFLKKKRQNG